MNVTAVCSTRWLAPLLAGLLAASGALAAEGDVARLIRKLGADSFNEREDASRKLAALGDQAEDQLRKALQSKDPEVVRRVQSLLELIQYGVPPGASTRVVALHFKYLLPGPEQGSHKILDALAEEGPVGFKSINGLLRTIKNDHDRANMTSTYLITVPASKSAALIAKGNLDKAEEILEGCSWVDHALPRENYARFLARRGKLDQAIARLRPLADDKYRSAAWTLAYLYRLKGDLPQAEWAAAIAGQSDLLKALRANRGDWKSFLQEDDLTTRKWDCMPDLMAQITYHRLAGDQHGSDVLMKKLLGEVKADKKWAGVVSPYAIALILNDKPREAFALLEKDDLFLRRFEIRCAHGRFDDAFALADQVLKDYPDWTRCPREYKANALANLAENLGQRLTWNPANDPLPADQAPLAAAGKWKEAAAECRQSWERYAGDPVILFQWGWCLVQQGQTAEGRRLMETAYWIPKDYGRYHFADALSRLGFPAKAALEDEMALRFDNPDAGFGAEPADRLGLWYLYQGDHERALACFERCRVCCSRFTGGMHSAGNYLLLSHRVNHARTLAHLAAGRFEKAQQSLRLCQELLPCDVNVLADAIPMLDKRGRRKEGDQLFNDAWDRIDKICGRDRNTRPAGMISPGWPPAAAANSTLP